MLKSRRVCFPVVIPVRSKLIDGNSSDVPDDPGGKWGRLTPDFEPDDQYDAPQVVSHVRWLWAG